MDVDYLAKKIRIRSLTMANRAKVSHIGSCLSCADILAVLYGSVMKYKASEPEWTGRDRLILSKGHAAMALYAVLAECGFFSPMRLDTHCQSGSELLGHVNHKLPGVEASTGALGHGLSIGCGIAMTTKSRVFVLLSDGDLNEGSTWEAIMFAHQHKLRNLVAIVDYNRVQGLGASGNILDFPCKWSLSTALRAIGWSTLNVDGHEHRYLKRILNRTSSSKPTLIVAHTVKGKGVSFMENKAEWHYKYPSDKELEKALEELK